MSWWMNRVNAIVRRPKTPIELRDEEWMNALRKEFNCRGGAILTEDLMWVTEPNTAPEQGARMLKLYLSKRDDKLHDYEPPPPIVLKELKPK